MISCLSRGFSCVCLLFRPYPCNRLCLCLCLCLCLLVASLQHHPGWLQTEYPIVFIFLSLIKFAPISSSGHCTSLICKPIMLALKVNSHCCMVGVYNSSGPPKAKTSGRNSQRRGPSNNLLLTTVIINDKCK